MSGERLSALRQEIEARVRPTICQTFSSDGRENVEGRISQKDFEVLILLATGKFPEVEIILHREMDRIQRTYAALIVDFMKSEIGRLMHQAEHWAKNDKPLAVHHRLHKADAYFQILCLFERFATFNENPFEKMRDDLARSTQDKVGTWPPGADLHRYREPVFVASLAVPSAQRNDLIAALKTAIGHIEHMAAFIGNNYAGYSFESLGEDMPGIRDALAKASGATK